MKLKLFLTNAFPCWFQTFSVVFVIGFSHQLHLFNPIFDISDQFLETLKDIQSRLNFYSLRCNIRLRWVFLSSRPCCELFQVLRQNQTIYGDKYRGAGLRLAPQNVPPGH